MSEILDPPAKTNRDKDGVAAVGRALALVAAFDERHPRLTLAELAKRTGFYKSTILRLSVSLERAGFLARDPDGAFRVGAAALKAGQVYQAAFRLGDVALPILRKLANETGETASLYVREGEWRVCLHRVESAQMVRAIVREGDRRPLDRGAAGKILREPVANPAVAPDGFAVSIGEVTAESAAVAAPVYDADARIVAAISVSGPAQRFARAALPAMGAKTKAAGAELTRRLGGAPPL